LLIPSVVSQFLEPRHAADYSAECRIVVVSQPSARRALISCCTSADTGAACAHPKRVQHDSCQRGAHHGRLRGAFASPPLTLSARAGRGSIFVMRRLARAIISSMRVSRSSRSSAARRSLVGLRAGRMLFSAPQCLTAELDEVGRRRGERNAEGVRPSAFQWSGVPVSRRGGAGRACILLIFRRAGCQVFFRVGRSSATSRKWATVACLDPSTGTLSDASSGAIEMTSVPVGTDCSYTSPNREWRYLIAPTQTTDYKTRSPAA